MTTASIQRALPPLPNFMQDLPVDPERGYPVPWFVQWIGGKPEFRSMDRKKLVKAINERLCWVCGNKLFREQVFVIGPMGAVNRISAEPPSHRECAIFSAMACPFLTKPKMVRRESDLPLPVEQMRANVPGIMIDRNPGVILLWYTRRHQLISDNGGVLFRIGHPFRLDWYANGRPATAEEARQGFETGLPFLTEIARKYDGLEGLALLATKVEIARKLLPR